MATPGLLIAPSSADHDAWQARHLIDEICSRFPVPIAVFEIDRARHAPTAAGWIEG